MRIGFLRVFVSDFEKSLVFYRDTLGMKLDFTDQTNWAQFFSGKDVSLAIELCDPNKLEQGSKLVGRFVGVTLIVDDLDATYADLCSRGVGFSSKPELQPWGGKVAHFRDPDGNVLTLMQSRED